MRTGLVPLASWGIALIAIALLGWLVFGLSTLPTALLAGAGAASAVTGAASASARRGRTPMRSAGGIEVDTDLSLATVALAAGGTLALVGVGAAGAAFFWTGLGLAVLGAGGMLRETVAARQELEALEGDGDRGGRS